MAYSLDTNILLHLLLNSPTAANTVAMYFDSDSPTIVVSIAAKAEIEALGMKRGWGEKKLTNLRKLMAEFLVIPISTDDLVARYAEIDAFSQGNHPKYKLPQGMSARNMGKNDLWIAATASVTKTTLLTTDDDFDHLINSPFLQVQKVPIL